MSYPNLEAQEFHGARLYFRVKEYLERFYSVGSIAFFLNSRRLTKMPKITHLIVIIESRLRLFLGSVLVSALVACSQPILDTSTLPQSPLLEASKNQQFNSETGARVAVEFGILAIDSARSVHDRYGPLMDYLSEEVGHPFKLVSLNQDSQFAQVETSDLEFIASNPLASVQIQRFYKTQFITTLQRPKTGSKFSALIITRRDSEIQTLQDLKGKRVACVDFETAAAGCLFQIHHLLQNGINPTQDFAEFIENPSQDSIVLGVLNRAIDAGFIRTGQLERMIESGLIESMEDLKILAPRTDDFFFSHTTELYPEWPIAALQNTDSALVEAVKAALLKVPVNHPALKAANLTGFTVTESYESIHNLIENLELKSWDVQ